MSRTGRFFERSPRHRHAILRDHLRDSTWIIPGLFGLAALALGVIVSRWGWLHDSAGQLGYRGEVASAQNVLTTIAAAMLAFMAVVFSATLVALQLASGQFSPRVLRTFQRDRRTQVVQGIFLATFVYTLTTIAELGRSGNRIVPLEVAISFLLVGASLVAFLLYVQHISRSVRAVYVIDAIAAETRRSIEHVYPRTAGVPPALPELHDRPATSVAAPRPGVIAAVDLDRLAALASGADVFVRLRQPVGVFVAEGQPLLDVIEIGGSAAGAQLPRDLLRHVDLAASRTMYQDVAFGFRQLVDIAERALSPAVNDPTTAVQALDRIADLVRRIAVRPQPSGITIDDAGRARVLLPIPDWASTVELALEEIRWYGRDAMQITRRLTAILDDLDTVVSTERREPITRQRELLAASVAGAFPPPLQGRALVADTMGLGG